MKKVYDPKAVHHTNSVIRRLEADEARERGYMGLRVDGEKEFMRDQLVEEMDDIELISGPVEPIGEMSTKKFIEIEEVSLEHLLDADLSIMNPDAWVPGEVLAEFSIKDFVDQLNVLLDSARSMADLYKTIDWIEDTSLRWGEDLDWSIGVVAEKEACVRENEAFWAAQEQELRREEETMAAQKAVELTIEQEQFLDIVKAKLELVHSEKELKRLENVMERERHFLGWVECGEEHLVEALRLRWEIDSRIRTALDLIDKHSQPVSNAIQPTPTPVKPKPIAVFAGGLLLQKDTIKRWADRNGPHSKTVSAYIRVYSLATYEEKIKEGYYVP